MHPGEKSHCRSFQCLPCLQHARLQKWDFVKKACRSIVSHYRQKCDECSFYRSCCGSGGGEHRTLAEGVNTRSFKWRAWREAFRLCSLSWVLESVLLAMGTWSCLFHLLPGPFLQWDLQITAPDDIGTLSSLWKSVTESTADWKCCKFCPNHFVFYLLNKSMLDIPAKAVQDILRDKKISHMGDALPSQS